MLPYQVESILFRVNPYLLKRDSEVFVACFLVLLEWEVQKGQWMKDQSIYLKCPRSKSSVCLSSYMKGESFTASFYAIRHEFV